MVRASSSHPRLGQPGVTSARRHRLRTAALLWLTVSGMTFGTVACGAGPETGPSADAPVTTAGGASSLRP